MEEASGEQPPQAGRPVQNDNGDNNDEEEEDRTRNEAAAIAEAPREDETEESLWDSVIRWNQAGVSFLQRLLFAQAASTFARAMRALHEQSTMALTEEEGDTQNHVDDDDDAVDANAVRRMRVTFPTAITSLRPAGDRGASLEVVGQQPPTIPSVVPPQQQQQEEPSEPEDDDANSWPSPPFLRPPMEHWQQDDGHWSSSFHIYNKAAHISALSSNDAGEAETCTTYAEDVEDVEERQEETTANSASHEDEGEIAGPNPQNNDDRPAEGDSDNNDTASEENQELQNQAQAQAQAQRPQPPLLRTNNDNFTLAYVSAALLYNAGLVQHLKGCAARTTTTTTNHPTVTTTTQRETAVSLQPVSYRKSLQLYQMGARTLQNCFEQQQLQHQEQQNVETPPDEHLQEAPHEQGQRRRHVFYKQCQLLYLALINNMAHIYLHFSNRAAHNQCCNVLRGVLATRQTNELPQQQDDEQQFFVLNLIASQNLERQAAATA